MRAAAGAREQERDDPAVGYDATEDEARLAERREQDERASGGSEPAKTPDATPLGTWAATPVDASLLTGVGPISDLRLSRDGARVAAIAGGHLVVGAVVIDQGSVTIKIK